MQATHRVCALLGDLVRCGDAGAGEGQESLDELKESHGRLKAVAAGWVEAGREGRALESDKKENKRQAARSGGRLRPRDDLTPTGMWQSSRPRIPSASLPTAEPSRVQPPKAYLRVRHILACSSCLSVPRA